MVTDTGKGEHNFHISGAARDQYGQRGASLAQPEVEPEDPRGLSGRGRNFNYVLK